MKNSLRLLLVFALVISCSEDQNMNRDFSAQNEADILAYIAENNLNATRSASGLYYVIDELGTGEQAQINSNVTVIYRGTYLNGEQFDSSNGSGISFNLRNVIPGWTEGITYFREGGSGILLIPSRLGYGSFMTRGIPGGSVLIFDVTLVSVN